MDDSHAEQTAHRAALALRTIVLSTRVAFEQVADADKHALIKAHAYELLSEFEQAVLMDGSDPTVLAGIAEAREGLRRYPTPRVEPHTPV